MITMNKLLTISHPTLNASLIFQRMKALLFPDLLRLNSIPGNR